MRALAILVLLSAAVAGAVAGAAGAARAEGDRAGDFDYYILALSWTPGFCAAEGDARGAEQCAARHDHGFTLHGLWPQHERGWPSDCRTGARDPSRAQTRAMADIMGSAGLAWHQWRKHGRCSGLTAEAYFAAARRALAGITIPAIFRAPRQDRRLSAAAVEAAFLAANPGLESSMITITCRDGRIREARICLTKDLAPRPCGRDVARDCGLEDALMDAVR